jgi:pimeloyl-ACP methyl ester carboxylesterase
MKSLFEKTISLQKGKVSRQQKFFVLLLLLISIFTLYVIAIRPYLMDNMATVPVELVIAFMLILPVIIYLLTFIITFIITLIVGIHTRRQVRITPWLLKLRSQLIVLITLSLMLAAFIVYSQKMAYTPPIVGDNGKVLAGSISTLEKVHLGGSEQWITIRGKNKKNPVLLFLAGGPGGSQLAATRIQLKKLEENFVVVNWDQPGAGKSYHAVPTKMLTPERYISDASQLTHYLCQRFNQEKIYVVGESWGSVLGILLVQRTPKLFNAFIGTGQMVAFTDTEIYDYEQALKIANERGDTKKSEELKKQGTPPYYGNDVTWKGNAYYGYLGDYMSKNPDIERPGYNTLEDLAGPEYGLYDKLNYVLGIINTFNHVYQQLYDVDLRKQAVKIDVPVYILEGRHDINAPTALAEEYFNSLNSPKKEFIWFEHSGHSPWINERDKFVDTMVNVVLKETQLKQ